MLPWRKTRDLYRILVSEVMLQQTQVERVIPFYRAFLKQFPNAKALASAKLSEVLRVWQGLGYNRRAKMLHQAAKQMVKEKPRTVEELEALPGVGPYTARAVAAFAWNLDVIVIETNIRTAVIHHFFPKKKKVSDTEIEKVLIEALPLGKAREWYSALMDYGAHLKRSGISHNARTARYVKQSAFRGSSREARGTLLRELAKRERSGAFLIRLYGEVRTAQMHQTLRDVVGEGLVVREGGVYRLAD